MMHTDWLALVLFVVPAILGGAIGYLWSLAPERSKDLAWRREPSLGNWRNIQIPEVDHLGRKEPTL